MRLTIPIPMVVALMLVGQASPTWGQSAAAVAARAVTPQEQAYLNEDYADEVAAEVDLIIERLGPISTMMHRVFPASVHGEIDATLAGYFEGQRPQIEALLVQAIAESMTLDEMRGMGLHTARALEIRQSIEADTSVFGQRLALGAIRHLCSVIQDRAPEECRTLLDRTVQYEAQIAD